MKSLTRKALSLAAAIAMASSCAVCAASIDTVTGSQAEGTTDVTVAYTATGLAAADQVTLLVFNADDAAEPTVTDAIDNFAYITQQDYGTGAAVTFPMRDKYVTEDGKIKPGNYKILMGCTGMTGEAASYTLEVKEDGTARLTGDVDGNGSVEPADAAAVIAHYLQVSILTGEDLATADVDNNGDVEPADAAAIIAIYLGL